MHPGDPKASTAPAARSLGRSTWTELVPEGPALLLVPVGSCEQHGPHLPLDTDTRIAVAIAGALASRRDDALVAPPVAYGASGEHQSFPGTLSIGTEALTTVLVELGRSAYPDPAEAHGRQLVFVNGHGGNLWGVRRAVEVLRAEGRPVGSWAPTVAGGDAHAGRTETSILLAIAGEEVRDERPVGETRPVAELASQMRADGVAAVSANGVLGDATGASAEEGRTILADLVDDLDRMIDGASGALPHRPEPA